MTKKEFSFEPCINHIYFKFCINDGNIPLDAFAIQMKKSKANKTRNK